MKVIRRGVIDWATLEVLEEDSFEYDGPIALAKDSGSPPQPVDPYQQAAAQYGLSTGTAEFNAALNRPNVVNPLGSTTWNVTGVSGPPPTESAPPSTPNESTPSGAYSLGGSGVPMPNTGSPQPSPSAPAASPGFGLGANNRGSIPIGGNLPGSPGGSGTPSWFSQSVNGSGAPIYTESTQLAPQFSSALQQPIDTSSIPGMPGGPNLNQAIGSTRNAIYDQEMSYLAPEQKLQSEQLSSQLAAEGLMPGSDAWNNEQARLGRQQTFATGQAVDNAITGGNNFLGEVYGLGSQSLQNQIAARQAPINEFNALNGAAGATANAMTPDISGAFGQQYQGALAGYNANVASNNATEGTIGSLALAAAMYF